MLATILTATFMLAPVQEAPVVSPPPAAPEPTTLQRLEVPQVPPTAAPPRDPRAALRRYLTRPVVRSVRFLDHGVVGAEAGVGVPHLYRLGLKLGLFDHVTLGATAHWLSGQAVPGWSPYAAVAFYRGRMLEVGAFYSQLLYPPVRDDGNPMTREFQPRAHYLMASVSLGQAWLTGGFDLGWARGREALANATKQELEANIAYAVRDRVAGGLHVRFGTRRVGLTAQAWFPFISAELVLDVRFGAFELRPRGGWREL
ncbi:MAG TPA: hypothetical protein VIK91_06350 [Nannocystis sp.]